ncbi:MAG TPA: hypothetical protein VGU20_01595 [Stellaceae bacterium]|nr:hypothetical protein [Stellaceae bacterium]
MAKLDDVFDNYSRSTKKSEATDSEAWFWITLTVACLPWLIALVVWRS